MTSSMRLNSAAICFLVKAAEVIQSHEVIITWSGNKLLDSIPTNKGHLCGNPASCSLDQEPWLTPERT